MIQDVIYKTLKMKEVLLMNRVNEFMNPVSRYGIIVLFLGILLSSSFSKYHILPLNIVIYLLSLVGVILVGYYIGKTVGESKNTYK